MEIAQVSNTSNKKEFFDEIDGKTLRMGVTTDVLTGSMLLGGLDHKTGIIYILDELTKGEVEQ